MTYGLHHCDYTCADCNHTWEDNKQRGYEKAAFEYSGCPKCRGKNCSWKTHKSVSKTKSKSPFIHGTSNNLGKPPKEFVDHVLTRIKDRHNGFRKNKSSINTDW